MSINYKFDERSYGDDLSRVGRKGYKFVLSTSLKEYNHDKHAFVAEWPQSVISFYSSFNAYFDESQNQSCFLSELSTKTDIIIDSSHANMWGGELFIKIRIYIPEVNIVGECWIMERFLSSQLHNLKIQDGMNDMLEYMSKENDTCVLDDLDESIKWIRYYYE